MPGDSSTFVPLTTPPLTLYLPWDLGRLLSLSLIYWSLNMLLCPKLFLPHSSVLTLLWTHPQILKHFLWALECTQSSVKSLVPLTASTWPGYPNTKRLPLVSSDCRPATPLHCNYLQTWLLSLIHSHFHPSTSHQSWWLHIYLDNSSNALKHISSDVLEFHPSQPSWPPFLHVPYNQHHTLPPSSLVLL